MFKLLIADVSPSVLSAIHAALPEEECEIFAFSDGAEVIQAMDTIKPDAVLLNLYLEGKDGYDVCHFINAQDRFEKIPIFLLRGAFEIVDEQRLSGLKYRDMIDEPFDSGHLALLIKEAVAGGEEPPALPEEPVFEADSPSLADPGRDIKSWIVEILERSEDRIRREVKILVADEVKKILGEKGSFPSRNGEESERED